MIKKLLSIVLAAVMALPLIPTAASAEPAAPEDREESGLLWDMETNPMMESLTDVGFFPLDSDGDGYCWMWTDDGAMSHYEGNGYIYSLSSMNGMPLSPDNILVIPAFTGSSFSFYVNEAAEGDYHDVLGVFISRDGGANWNEELNITLDGTEPAVYTIETGDASPACAVMFRHYNCSGEAGVVIDYISIPDGELYEAPPEPYAPEVPDGMIPIESAEIVGLITPEIGALALTDFTVPEDANYSIDYAMWMRLDETDGSATGLFEDDAFAYFENCTFYCEIHLVPDEGFWFDAHADTTINGDESLVEAHYVDLNDGSMTVESICFEIEPQELEMLDLANLEGFNPPVIGEMAGDSLDGITVPEGGNFEIVRFYWFSDDYDSELESDHVFEEGVLYNICVKIKPVSGYGFNEEMIFTINGNAELVDPESSFFMDSQNALISSIPVYAVSGGGDPALYGDVDGDGTVAASDAILAVRYMLELIELSNEQLAAADVNGDGEIGLADAIFIARYSLGLIESFPIEN